MKIENLTSKELLELAKKKELEENKAVRPEVVLSSNSYANESFIKLAEDYMNFIEEVIFTGCDNVVIDTQPAYELLMETVYGEDAFKYLNSLED
jgi:hypothetical protein